MQLSGVTCSVLYCIVHKHNYSAGICNIIQRDRYKAHNRKGFQHRSALPDDLNTTRSVSLLPILCAAAGESKSNFPLSKCYKTRSNPPRVFPLWCYISSWETQISINITFQLKSRGQGQRRVWCVWYWHFRKSYRARLSVVCYSKLPSALPCVFNWNHSGGQKPDAQWCCSEGTTTDSSETPVSEKSCE